MIKHRPSSQLPGHRRLEGALAFELGGEAITLTQGRTLTAPPSTLHGLRNETESPVTVRVVVNPGTIAERGLRAYFGLCRDGLVTKAGMPKNPFVGAIILHGSGTYFPPLPVWLSRIIFAALAAVGHRMGGEKILARYWEPPGREIAPSRCPTGDFEMNQGSSSS